jgi:hypothetical protein
MSTKQGRKQAKNTASATPLLISLVSQFSQPNPRFLEFPAEIRIMIWHHAINNIPKQCVVTVKNPSVPLTSFDTTDSPHALLHACAESRELFLPRYTSAFGLPKLGWEYKGSMKSTELNKTKFYEIFRFQDISYLKQCFLSSST